MKLLDYGIFPAFLERWFGAAEQVQARLVGPARDRDYGYFGIVRFFGEGAPDPRAIAIRRRDTLRTLDDPQIVAYARRTEKELRDSGRLYEGPQVTAVTAARFVGPDPHLEIQPCDYGLFAGSCFALDRPAPEFFGRGDTLREYYARAYPGRDPANHPLAGCLGVCGLLLVRGDDGKSNSILVVERAGHLASLENSTGPSAAGSVDWDTACLSLWDLLRDSLAREVQEELGLLPGEITIRPLAYAREIFRGEKPQLFALIETDPGRTEIEERIAQLPGEREFDQYRFIMLDAAGEVDASERAHLNHEAAMNLALIEEFRAM